MNDCRSRTEEECETGADSERDPGAEPDAPEVGPGTRAGRKPSEGGLEAPGVGRKSPDQVSYVRPLI